MKRLEEYSICNDVDQIVTVQSGVDGIVIIKKELNETDCTRTYLTVSEAKELSGILIKATQYQIELGNEDK